MTEAFVKGLMSTTILVCLLFVLALNVSATSRAVEKYVKKGNVEKLIALLMNDKKSNYIRVDAAEALGEIRDKRAVEPLISTMLNDRNYSSLRAKSVWALRVIGDERAVEPMCAILTKPSSDGPKETIAYALGDMGDERAVDPLLHFLQDTKIGPRSRVSAIEALGKIGGRKATQALLVAAAWNWKESEKYLGKRAEKKIVGMRESAIDPLAAALKDDNADVREAAAKLLVRAGWKASNDSEKALLLIAERDWTNLLKLDKSCIVAPLITRLEDDNENVREQAALALWKIGEPRPLEIYIGMLNSSSVDARLEAARLLLSVKDPETKEASVQALIGMLNSSSVDVRLEAAKLLLSVKDPKRKEALGQALNVIEESTYITEFRVNNAHGQTVFIRLYNTDGKEVARRTLIYSQFNSRLATKEIFIVSEDTIHVTDYDANGRATNPMWLCLDKKGNVIKRNGKPILVRTFSAEQKSETKINYGLGRMVISKEKKIYPCKNCVQETQIAKCRYVW